MPSGPLAQGAAYPLYESVALHDIPAGYWRLDNAAPTTDESGNANTLSTVASPANIAGLITAGEARDFNGSTQAYTAADHSSLDLGDFFTLEVWIKPDSVTGAHTLISKGTNGYQLRTNGTAVELLKQGDGVILATTGITLVVGQSYHIVATKEGALSSKIYVNGVDRSGSVTVRTCANTSTSLNIARKSDSTEWYDGVLDEVAVCAYPITADMVATHYAAGTGTFGTRLRTSFPAIKVEIAFESAWNAAYPLWEDVTDYLRIGPGMTLTQSGRQDETQRSAPGAGDVSLGNRDQRFDPDVTTGPYGARVVPMRAIRFRAEWNGSLYWLLRGWIESWPPTYPGYGADAITDVDVVDFFAAFVAAEFPLETSFSAELAGARIESCLDLLSVPASMRNIDAGISTMPAIEAATGRVLDHLLAVADSDGGFFYVGPDGRVVYEDRRHRFESESVSRGIVGTQGAELPYVDLPRSSDTAYLFNEAQVSSGDGTGTAEARDQESVDEYGPRTFTKSLLTGFNECQAAAEWYVARYKDPATRFTGVTFLGEKYPSLLWPVLLGAYNSNRYTFKHRPLGGTTIEQDAFIERITHDVGPGGWKTTWHLSPFGDEDPWVLGASAADVLGTDTYPTW
jgi:hypothetical protein